MSVATLPIACAAGRLLFNTEVAKGKAGGKRAAGKNAVNVGCESCHGPGSLHAESGGEVKPPFSFTSGRPPSGMAAALPSVPTPRSDEGICYQCHLETRGQFQLASHHPVPEGRLTCWECHPPHKAPQGFACLPAIPPACRPCPASP